MGRDVAAYFIDAILDSPPTLCHARRQGCYNLSEHLQRARGHRIVISFPCLHDLWRTKLRVKYCIASMPMTRILKVARSNIFPGVCGPLEIIQGYNLPTTLKWALSWGSITLSSPHRFVPLWSRERCFIGTIWYNNERGQCREQHK